MYVYIIEMEYDIVVSVGANNQLIMKFNLTDQFTLLTDRTKEEFRVSCHYLSTNHIVSTAIRYGIVKLINNLQAVLL